jgi:hypothetical protein
VNTINPNLKTHFSRCGCCNRKLTDEDIDIAGIGTDGLPNSVGHCCVNTLSMALLVGIPSNTRSQMLNNVVRFLESKGVDVEPIKRIHAENTLPYALHIFKQTPDCQPREGDIDHG